MPEMSNPFTNMQPGRKMDLSEILAALREDLIAELDAINLYQAHIDAIDDERVKKVIAHIRDEEKEHVAEFLEIIKELDPTQAEMFAAEHPTEIRNEAVEALPTERAVSEESAEAESGGPKDVGSLLRVAQDGRKE